MSSPALQKLTLAEIREQFVADTPRDKIDARPVDLVDGRIEDCHAYRLWAGSDKRGDLFELVTTRDEAIEPMVHAYQVWAEAGSVRGWVYHARQTDRLCFTGGAFEVALYDMRNESRTAGALISLTVGAETPVRLSIPALVAHAVRNLGAERASFINLPTRVYQHDAPDKFRLSMDSGLIPLRW